MASINEDIEKVLAHLVKEIDTIGFKNGGRHDNLTAALVEIDTINPINKRKSSTKKSNSFFHNINSFLRDKLNIRSHSKVKKP
ncbi:MAG: hypothetical protein IPF68_03495 [Bacteroidales bacterium]|nr:hypothetical protein [Bacteroidales bacterium]